MRNLYIALLLLFPIGTANPVRSRKPNPDPHIVIAGQITLGGIRVDPSHPPLGLKTYSDIGIILDERIMAQRLHSWRDPGSGAREVRAVKTPGGDYFVMFPAGAGRNAPTHGKLETNRNEMIAYRSADQGRTWSSFPERRLNGRFLKELDRMGEGSLIDIGRGNLLVLARTREGYLREYRSSDDGKTWSEPNPTILVQPEAPRALFHLSDGKTLVAFHRSWFDPKTPHIDLNDRGELWCSVSKDLGKTWSEPRFVLADATGGKSHQILCVDMLQDAGRVHLFVSQGRRQVLHIYFQTYHFETLATLRDLATAPASNFVKKSVSLFDQSEWKVADNVIAGDTAIDTNHPPKGLVLRTDLGLVTHELVEGQVIHRSRTPSANPRLYETRAAVTPRGDYLLMFPDGLHATGHIGAKVNDLLAYRSSDKGMTWHGPTVPYGWEVSHRAFIPLVPHGSSRIYALGSHTMRSPNPLGYRYSDDEGYTWSDLMLIEPEFSGTGVIQMCETEAGSWLMGFHRARILRGEKQNERRVWTCVPLNRPSDGYSNKVGWDMDELRIISGIGSEVLAFARTREGHLWMMRSEDDGKNWSDPIPTPLVHPDAPPMIFRLSDGRLIALHHNRCIARTIFEPKHHWLDYPSYNTKATNEWSNTKWSLHDWVSRNQVWFSISWDEGKSWSEPRFLFVNAVDETLENANLDYSCSYLDLFVDGGDVHIFFPHRWRQVLHLHFKQSDLDKFPVKSDLEK